MFDRLDRIDQHHDVYQQTVADPYDQYSLGREKERD